MATLWDLTRKENLNSNSSYAASVSLWYLDRMESPMITATEDTSADFWQARTQNLKKNESGGTEYVAIQTM